MKHSWLTLSYYSSCYPISGTKENVKKKKFRLVICRSELKAATPKCHSRA